MKYPYTLAEKEEGVFLSFKEITIYVRELKKIEIQASQHLSLDGWLYLNVRSKTQENI